MPESTKKFAPGHYFTLVGDRDTVFDEIAEEPRIRGGMERVNWKTLEPTKGNYAWAAVENLATIYHSKGLTFSPFIQIKAFQGSVVPAYLKTAAYDGGVIPLDAPTNDPDGADGENLKCWNPAVRAAWKAFMQAMAAEFDTDPRIYCIHLNENSFGKVKTPLTTAQKTAWLAGWREMVRDAQAAWPNTVIVAKINNHMDMEEWPAQARASGHGIGSPDLYMGADNLETNGTYDAFRNNMDPTTGGNVLFSQMECNPENYRNSNHYGPNDPDHPPFKQDVHLIYNKAKSLRLNHVYWSTDRSVGSYKGWTEFLKMLDEPAFPTAITGGLRAEIPTSLLELEPPVALAKPTGLVASEIAPTSARVTWNAVAGATSYKVWKGGAVVASGITELTYVLTGLPAETAAWVNVSAVNATEESAKSVGLSFTTLALPIPAAPPAPTIEEITPRTAKVRWIAVPTALSYRVRLDGVLVSSANPNTFFVLEGLAPDSTHDVTVSAVNSYGVESAVSAVTSFATAALPIPTTPVLVLDTNTRDLVKVKWEPSAHAVSYVVTVNGLSHPSALEVNVVAPALDTDYVFSVVAVSADAVASPAGILTVRTLAPLVYTALNMAVKIEGQDYVLSGTVLVTKV